MINTYNSIVQPAITGTISITDWLNKIQSSEHSKTITAARAGLIDYTNTKKQLPAVTWNFRFIEYKKDTRCIYSTGFIFIDIDDKNFDINTLDKSKIFSYYQSFGGKGYGIIVKTKGIVFDNFKASYLTICNDLGISSFIDKNAIKASQFSVLSYDPNLFLNPESFVFDFSLSLDELNQSISNYRKEILELNFYSKSNNLKLPLTNLIEEGNINKSNKENIWRLVRGKIENPIRYTNIDDFEFDSDFICNWNEGLNFIRCYLPSGKLKDKRKRTILSYTTNLVFLNPDIKYLHALSILENINKVICNSPLDSNILEGILKSILNQKNENRLKPHITLRRILFKPNSELNTEDKLFVCGRLIKEKFEVEGCQRLNSIIEEWDFDNLGKISIRKIAKNSDMNERTIEKYYHHFKELINSLNNEYKKNK